MELPTIEEFLNDKAKSEYGADDFSDFVMFYLGDDLQVILIIWIKEHEWLRVQWALKVASEQARLMPVFLENVDDCIIDKQSILDAVKREEVK